MSELIKKVDKAINLLWRIDTSVQPAEVCYSGGKDSDVILHLAKLAGLKYRAIYKNTTIDPPGTIKHCKDNGVEIINPDKSFLQLIEKNGVPSRWSRWCCSCLKEYKILNSQIVGIRRDESRKRAARYKEPTQCRNYGKGQHVEQFMPILDWTIDDVEEFVKAENITLAPHYYNPDGSINFFRRLGCVGCPLQSQKKRIADFKQYPKMLRQIVKRADIFKRNHMREQDPIISGADVLYLQLFCKNKAHFLEKTNTLFGKIDTRAELERIFNITLK